MTDRIVEWVGGILIGGNPVLRRAAAGRRVDILRDRPNVCVDCAQGILLLPENDVSPQIAFPDNGLFVHEDEYRFPFRLEHASLVCHNHHMRRHERGGPFPMYASYRKVLEGR